ncbi:vWA domain-containing protein [Kineosporia succinea]|uniref:Uncharacterized protein with von Willebrand factor type A (VWA) domain n=1 Tax=Kineosporia succinea TaxID=84632 RepID=A0ABT9P5F5_9ACTN|nr:VWA domain-containing protein [Kineosporia succinea]MDP9827921.1 uncharacterized protein with von Willebrand factor type A (vWA) domain [Kineosporia succinea]
MQPVPLRGIDTAAFVVSLADRLRTRGVRVGLSAMEDVSVALGAEPIRTRSQLYWTTRITLVRRYEDLAVFDQVFEAVFDAVMPLDPVARRNARRGDRGRNAAVPGDSHGEEAGSGLPWLTLPPAVGGASDAGEQRVPRRNPSALDERAGLPFERLSDDDLRELGDRLEEAALSLPRRRSRRLRVSSTGGRIQLRDTMTRARRTGWDPVELVRATPRPKPRRVLMICDVSQSMQAPSVAFLHLMRALVLRCDAEGFAFATSLTRLTHRLAHRSAPEAFDRASAAVTDRFGGTRIAANLQSLMASHHGGLLRGAVVIIASDGWDSEPPERMTAAMARLKRRAHRVLWLNPRSGAPGYEPKVATMAAALPFCDAMLPADSFRSLENVFRELSSRGSHGSTAGTARR